MIKGVWYHDARGSFWSELADSVIPAGASASPRQCALADLVQHLTQLRDELRVNTVAVTVPDDDSWQANVGGGFSYDPSDRPTPDKAFALETFLAVADHIGLKVVVCITVSEYRYLIDDTYNAPVSAKGAWDWLHSVLDPTVYYSLATTNDLTPIIGHETTIRPLIGDARIAGLLFGFEWKLATIDGDIATKSAAYFAKWYSWFEMLAHYPPNKPVATSWSGAYAPASPQDAPAAVPRLIALREALPATAMCGLEAYGNGAYSLAGISLDLTKLVPSAGLSNLTLICEGGSDNVDSLVRHWYYVDVGRSASQLGLAGVIFWSADAFANEPGQLDTSQAEYAMFDGVFTPVGVADYPAVPGHWDANSQYGYTDPRRYAIGQHSNVTYGRLKLTLNEVGQAVAFAFANL